MPRHENQLDLRDGAQHVAFLSAAKVQKIVQLPNACMLFGENWCYIFRSALFFPLSLRKHFFRHETVS